MNAEATTLRPTMRPMAPVLVMPRGRAVRRRMARTAWPKPTARMAAPAFAQQRSDPLETACYALALWFTTAMLSPAAATAFFSFVVGG